MPQRANQTIATIAKLLLFIGSSFAPLEAAEPEQKNADDTSIVKVDLRVDDNLTGLNLDDEQRKDVKALLDFHQKAEGIIEQACQANNRLNPLTISDKALDALVKKIDTCFKATLTGKLGPPYTPTQLSIFWDWEHEQRLLCLHLLDLHNQKQSPQNEIHARQVYVEWDKQATLNGNVEIDCNRFFLYTDEKDKALHLYWDELEYLMEKLYPPPDSDDDNNNQ